MELLEGRPGFVRLDWTVPSAWVGDIMSAIRNHPKWGQEIVAVNMTDLHSYDTAKRSFIVSAIGRFNAYVNTFPNECITILKSVSGIMQLHKDTAFVQLPPESDPATASRLLHSQGMRMKWVWGGGLVTWNEPQACAPVRTAVFAPPPPPAPKEQVRIWCAHGIPETRVRLAAANWGKVVSLKRISQADPFRTHHLLYEVMYADARSAVLCDGAAFRQRFGELKFEAVNPCEKIDQPQLARFNLARAELGGQAEFDAEKVRQAAALMAMEASVAAFHAPRQRQQSRSPSRRPSPSPAANRVDRSPSPRRGPSVEPGHSPRRRGSGSPPPGDDRQRFGTPRRNPSSEPLPRSPATPARAPSGVQGAASPNASPRPMRAESTKQTDKRKLSPNASPGDASPKKRTPQRQQ
jgi:hypothetical protein